MVEFRQVVSALEARGRLKRVQADQFLSSLASEDGRMAVMDSSYPVSRVGNVVLSRELLAELLGTQGTGGLHLRLAHAVRNPLPLKEAERSATEEEVESDAGFLPVPEFHGRTYVTSGIIVASDGEHFNASYHRMMKLSDDKFAVRIVPRHLYKMLSQARERREPLKVAVVLGGPLEFLMASASSPEYGVFELEVANSLAGGELTFRRSPLFGLPYPAGSEILLEGTLDPMELASEGPFFDLLKTYDAVRAQPVLTVQRAHHRSGPLFHYIMPGGMEHQILMGLPREAKIREFVGNVVPSVRGVYLTPGGGTWLHAVVSIEKQRDGDAKNAMLAAFSAHPSLKHVVVVDPDVEVTDGRQVEWAIATRFRADKGLLIVPGAAGSTLDPSALSDGETTKMGIDATYPIREAEKYKRVDYQS